MYTKDIEQSMLHSPCSVSCCNYKFNFYVLPVWLITKRATHIYYTFCIGLLLPTAFEYYNLKGSKKYFNHETSQDVEMVPIM